MLTRNFLAFICISVISACAYSMQTAQTKNNIAREGEYYDVAIFDLKGPVKSVKTISIVPKDDVNLDIDMGFGFCMDNHSFKFQEDGLWRKNSASISLPNNYAFTIQRSHDGNIKSLKGNMSYPTILIKFDWNDGQVVKIEYLMDEDAEGSTESVTEFTYKNGTVESMKYKCSSCEGECTYTDCDATVSDVKYDQHGNWVSRKLNIVGTYQYTGYDWATERERTVSDPINETIIQTRMISYW